MGRIYYIKHNMYTLSIVIPTFRRPEHLRRCLRSLTGGCGAAMQVVAVYPDGDEPTQAVLREYQSQLNIKTVVEAGRNGFVHAANSGFAAADGEYLMWLNDDARPLPGALEAALTQLRYSPADVGLVALFHQWRGIKNIAYETVHQRQVYRLLHIRGTLYANFGIGRREVFAQLGYFDPRYYLNGADPDFSLKVWDAGWRVEPAWGALLEHDEHADDRRAADQQRSAADNAALFAKWPLPPKNLYRNDFDPLHPSTLRRLSSPAQAA